MDPQKDRRPSLLETPQNASEGPLGQHPRQRQQELDELLQNSPTFSRISSTALEA